MYKLAIKVKYTSDNTVDKLKARHVANNYNQQEGINFFETFSRVVKQVTIRMILSLAVIQKWHIHQLDVTNAFLNGILWEIVYLTLQFSPDMD